MLRCQPVSSLLVPNPEALHAQDVDAAERRGDRLDIGSQRRRVGDVADFCIAATPQAAIASFTGASPSAPRARATLPAPASA